MMASSTQINKNAPLHHGIPTGFSWAEFLFPFCFEYQQNKGIQNQNISFYTTATSRITGSGISSISKFHQRRSTDCGLACVATVVSLFDHPSPSFSSNNNNHHEDDVKSCSKNKREQRLIYDRIETIFARNFSPSSSSSSSSSLLSPHQQAINLAVLSSTPMWTVEMFELFRILLFSDNNTSSSNSGAKYLKFYTSLKSVEEIANQWKKHCEKYPLFYQQQQQQYQRDDTSMMMMMSDSSRLSSMCQKLEGLAKLHQNAEEQQIQLHVNTKLPTSTIVNQLVSSSCAASATSSSVFVVLVNSLFLDCNCRKSEAVSQLALAGLSLDENIVSKVAAKLLSKAQALSLTKAVVPFVGHFVVVVGISKCRNYFLVWDPASHSGVQKNGDGDENDADYSFCVVSYDSLDKARKIHEDGTDLEVIEIGY